MCGLVGAASGYLSKSEIDNFEDLMIVSNLRGRTGAGVIIVNENGRKVHGIKSPKSGIDVIEMSKYKEQARDKHGPNILAGHTRLPTRGGDDLTAVHPHMCKNLAGVHNGTMHRVRGKSLDAGVSDSKALYEHISEVGVKEALRAADGAYALVFVDYLDGTLNFIRNSQRPLWFAQVAWGSSKTLYWASEASFLHLVLTRNRVKFEIKELPINQLWSIPCTMRGDFEVYDGITSGVNSWPRHPITHTREEVEAGEHWSASVPFSHQTRSGSLVTLPSKVTPEFKPSSTGTDTFGVRNGIVVRKGHDDKKVTLPGTNSNSGDEQEGSSKAESSVEQTSGGNNKAVSKRAAADVQVRSPKKSGHLRVVPQVPLSKDEQEFQLEMEEAAKWREGVEDDFDKLMAKRYPDAADGEAVLEDPVDDLFDKAYAKGNESEEHFLETEKGTFLSSKRVREICQNGCAYCGDAVDYSKSLAWVDRTEFLCDSCQGSFEALSTMHDFYPFSQIMTDWRDGKLKGVRKPPSAAWSDDLVLSSTDSRTVH